ncbi:DNA alkylation repair protein [Parasalinivibrio latis]|uniref:DNA alkylation repair protein n=1 Tax=Parasalinivibrio latis TaxID=2952610 RepID=UPI0030E5377D
MELLKNKISPQFVDEIANSLIGNIEDFDKDAFCKRVCNKLESLELKDRLLLITEELYQIFPSDIDTRNATLKDVICQLDSEGNPLLWGWKVLPFNGVIGQHGTLRFEESLNMLKGTTERFSSEFDVRYYLLYDLEKALAIMESWVTDPNHHVRRLVSEGTRPRLPWAMQLPALIKDPSPILPLLEKLRDDESEYVRRSVANNLNDISKDHPDLVAAIADQWIQGADKNRKRLVKHACRTLIKNGHSGAMSVFGFQLPELDIFRLSVETPRVQFGNNVVFSAILGSEAKNSQLLVIDYVMHFVKNNGKQSAKVFKWKTVTLKSGETIEISRSHAIKPITTRKYYPGSQGISLRINGQDYGNTAFELVM